MPMAQIGVFLPDSPIFVGYFHCRTKKIEWTQISILISSTP
jgi:hypothetical protein